MAKKEWYRLKLATGGYVALTYFELCAMLGFSEDSGVVVTNQNTISFHAMSIADIARLYDEVIKNGFVPAIALKKFAANCKAAISKEEA